MKLIVDKTQFGKEIPKALPASMIPPSLRGGQAQATGPQKDLLSLMDDDVPLSTLQSTAQAPISSQATGSSSYSASRLAPQGTGGSATGAPRRAASSPLAPITSVFPQNTRSESGFGLQGTIFPQATGMSGGVTPLAARGSLPCIRSLLTRA